MTDPCQAFLASLDQPAAPANTSGLLLAVWHGLRGEWDDAHNIAQDDHTTNGSWVHGWLHWIEGDLGNAGYWYRQAGRSRPGGGTREEGERIARSLLAP